MIQLNEQKNDRASLLSGDAREHEAPRIAVEGLTKQFGGVHAVDDCNLTVANGQITGLIGPNGAGKSTLFSIVSGFLRPDSGRVLLDGRDITGLAPHKLFHRGLVRTFQIPQEFTHLSALENLMAVPADQPGENPLTALLAPGLVQKREAEIRDQADEALDFLGMTKVRNVPVGELSGGQRKLIELGRAMMSGARTVLLDEPGAGVNPTLLSDLGAKILRLNQERGTTFCIVEHNMDLIARLCSKVVVMFHGSVLTSGSMQEIMKDPRVLEAYLGSGQAEVGE